MKRFHSLPSPPPSPPPPTPHMRFNNGLKWRELQLPYRCRWCCRTEPDACTDVLCLSHVEFPLSSDSWSKYIACWNKIYPQVIVVHSHPDNQTVSQSKKSKGRSHRESTSIATKKTNQIKRILKWTTDHKSTKYRNNRRKMNDQIERSHLHERHSALHVKYWSGNMFGIDLSISSINFSFKTLKQTINHISMIK